MPRGLNNWTYKDIVDFLKPYGFKRCIGPHSKKPGSHRYFTRNYKGRDCLVHIQYHANKTIPTGTMETIVSTSGIAKRKWTKR